MLHSIVLLSLLSTLCCGTNSLASDITNQKLIGEHSFSDMVLLTTANVPQSELQALQSLYISTGGDQWVWYSTEPGIPWDFSVGADPCTDNWQGVNCTTINDEYHVSSLVLTDHFLRGQIPNTLNDLPYLELLDFTSNFINGTIPSTIGDLPMLEALLLSSNRITGTIPATLGALTNLGALVLAFNRLIGTIPSELCDLTRLEVLSFGDNDLTGPIPQNIGKVIIMFDNYLSGSLPASVGEITYLQDLRVEDNFLNGTLPSEIGQLTSLLQLAIVGNSFMGTLPDELGNLGKLEGLYLGYNHFNGTLPASLGQLSSLLYLYGEANRFSGPLPHDIGNLRSLRELYLHINRLSGCLPASIGDMTSLEELVLYNNSIGCAIPESIGSAGNLTVVEISRNRLNGTLPASISQLAYLGTLILSDNEIEGELPEAWSALSRLTSLQVTDNKLVGAVPDSYSALIALQQLRLEHNRLFGTVPVSVLRIAGLQRLALGQNRLKGTIPDELKDAKSLVEIVLSYNELTGTIPAFLGQLRRLQYLELDNNALSGTIPSSLAGLHNLTQLTLNNNALRGTLDGVFDPAVQTELEVVLLNENRLTGTLPDAIFDLAQLAIFVGGSNCFSGSLPANICNSTHLNSLVLDGLESSPSCAKSKLPRLFVKAYTVYNTVRGTIPQCVFTMRQLNTLHLSGNGITGTLPSDVNVSASLLYLSLSHNSLSGTIPAAFQEIQWKQLDLSNNKLQGTLRPDFASKPINSTVKRLFVEVLGNIVGQELVTERLPNIRDQLDLKFNISLNTLVNILNLLVSKLPRKIVISTDHFEDRGQTLYLEDNRLSGLLPGSIAHRQNISVLGSNMFDCAYDKRDLPAHDQACSTYTCGSSAFNIPFYVWLATTCLSVAAVWLLWRYRDQCKRWWTLDLEPVYAKLSLWVGVFTGAVTFPEHEGSFKLDNVYATNRLLNIFGYITLVCMSFILLLLTPLYTILAQYYSTYTHEYAWTVSAAFLSGTAPAATEIVILVLTLLVILRSALSVDRFVLTIPQVRIDRIISMSVLAVDPAKQWWTKATVHAVYVVLNFFLVLGVNTAFVYVALHSSGAELGFAQVWLSVFKVMWNKVLSTKLLAWVHDTVAYALENPEEFSETKYVTVQVYVALLNNILIPCIVVALQSSSCFYNVFVQGLAVKAFYTREYCVIYDTDYEACVFNRFEIERTQYDPPFAYSYQCSSSLITNYAPAFVNVCFVTIFVVPLMTVAGQWLYLRATPGTRWHALLNVLLPQLVRMAAQVDHEDEGGRLSRAALTDRDKSVTQSYFHVNRLVINLIIHLATMLTFGAMFPPLAVATGVTIAAVIYYEKVNVGRFLSTMIKRGLFKYVHIVELECQELGSVSRLLQRSLWLLMVVKCCFYAIVVFDTLGDSAGFKNAYWVLIVLPLLPAVLYGVQQGCIRLMGASASPAAAVTDNIISGDAKIKVTDSDEGIELPEVSAECATVSALHTV